MEARELLLIAFAGAVIRGALFAQPPNVTYLIDEESCRLQVRWLPPNSNCKQIYTVAICINEKWDKLLEQYIENTSWEKNVPLGKKIAFGVKTSCQENGEDVSGWNDDETFKVVQNGAAGTGARNVTCIWWNRNYMNCSWQAGENASPDTAYRVSYWHDPMKKAKPCTNVSRNGFDFQCGFSWTTGNVPLIAISIQGNSGNIQPVCWLSKKINHLVKYSPPVLSIDSNNGSKVVLQWSKPGDFHDLHYEVEVDGVKKHTFKWINHGEIPVEPDAQHTFRVRVKSATGLWSEWSDMRVSGGRTSTFPLLLLVLIPLCVALLLVILLIYLKRIKLLILPKIPDPEKILKHMFEEQNENQPTHETANNEETHSLMIVEPAGNEK